MKTLFLRYHIPIILSLLCIVLAVLDSTLGEQLNFERTAILNGEVWRLLSGNLLHTNWNHLWLNLGGLWLIWGIFYDIGTNRWQWSAILVPIILTTPLLLWLSPDLHSYVGLSGALHGTIIAFGIADYRKNRWVSIGLILGVAIKLGFEQIYGTSESVKALIDADVAIDAHLWGAISGIVVGIWYLLKTDNNKKHTNKETNVTSEN